MKVFFEGSDRPTSLEVIDASLPNNGVLLAEEDVNHPEYSGESYRLYLGIRTLNSTALVVDSQVVCDGYGYDRAVEYLTNVALKTDSSKLDQVHHTAGYESDEEEFYPEDEEEDLVDDDIDRILKDA